jgi:hypothetical protein
MKRRRMVSDSGCDVVSTAIEASQAMTAAQSTITPTRSSTL